MNSKASGTGRSTGLRVLLRMSGGFLQVCLNLVIYAVIIILIYKAANYSYDFAYKVMGDVRMEEAPGRNVKLQILKGETSMNVATKLETNKLIDDKYAFFVKMKLNKVEIMPGTFVLNTSMNYDEIINIIKDYDNSVAKETTVEEAEAMP
ncbi:MAG: hypothetical protein MJ131_02165 [Lachnospiraceae bacterium]|nr:hypothetical protein [Lachnospiraceae bacterium]